MLKLHEIDLQNAYVAFRTAFRDLESAFADKAIAHSLAYEGPNKQGR